MLGSLILLILSIIGVWIGLKYIKKEKGGKE